VISPSAATGLSREHAAPVRCPAATRIRVTGNAMHDWKHLLLQRNLAVESAVHFHPGLTKNSSVQPTFRQQR